MANLIGRKFGKLTVIENNTEKKYSVICLCDCGKEIRILAGALTRRSKPTLSCGCLNREKMKLMVGDKNPNYKHGCSVGGRRSREFRIWTGMMQRCNNKNIKSYKDYGGRGIKVCDEWIDFNNFLRDMGKAPSGMTLDRRDNNKGYSKENCRWATQTQQTRNQRSNVLITYNGETKTVSEWAEIIGINHSTLRSRIGKLNWPIEKAMTTPETSNYP